MFGILASISSAVLIISNLAAGKLWNLFGIAADGGLIIFPVTYIVGDLIVALYGKKKANLVVLISTLMCGLMAIVMWIVVCVLPGFPSWDGQTAYELVFGQVGRITIASLVGYLLSNLLNNHVFVKIEGGFLGKALGSSVVSRLIDNLTFETIAFVGVLGTKDFLIQMLFAYLIGMALETLLAPVSKLVFSRLCHSKLYLADLEAWDAPDLPKMLN